MERITSYDDNTADRRADGSDWRSDAACIGYAPQFAGEEDLFFPVGSDYTNVAQINRAKAICIGCPVMRQCREFAFKLNIDEGIYGGMTREDRRAVRRKTDARNRADVRRKAAIVALAPDTLTYELYPNLGHDAAS